MQSCDRHDKSIPAVTLSAYLSSECGPSVLTSPEGEITSPGFPGSYPSYTNCTWTISVADNDTVSVFFSQIYMGFQYRGQGQDCLEWRDGAVLSVYDGDSVINETPMAM